MGNNTIRRGKLWGILIILMAGSIFSMAQRNIKPTDTVSITGKVKAVTYFTASALDTFPKVNIKDQIIYNHKGEIKDTLRNLRGVSLKSVLSPVEYIYEKPRTLNEFYFVFVASDGYKVVFSWNEIYNTEAGNSFFLITEMNGKKLEVLDERIAFLATSDLKTGRRYIKGLSRIEVRQVD